jgi:Mg2+-importing ATPase
VLNPLVILLSILASISFATGDVRAGTMMAVMIALGAGLKLVQETRADSAAAKLKAMISVGATVIRSGQAREIPISQLVPGDIVALAAGDMIPADVRGLTAKDLFVNQSTLTGESFPVEKFAAEKNPAASAPVEFTSVAFLGTSVESGAGTAVVVMVPLVFLINGFTKGNWHEAFFFAIAVAVGLTPEMLPMVVAVCLSKGAIHMSRERVIVKRLNAIQNLGAMDVLCTDKTGTLTMDRVILERHCDVSLNESEEVLSLAYMNSHFQTGLKNVLDRAVLAHTETHSHAQIPAYNKVDEVPFDFQRRIMSVVVRTPNRESLGRHHPPGEVASRLGGRCRRGAEGFCQHPEIRQDGREQQLREYVQCLGGERIRSLPAHDADSDSHQQSAVRHQPDRHSYRRRRS